MLSMPLDMGYTADAAPVVGESKPLILDQIIKNPDFSDEEPSVRIKDITQIQGVRDNHLIGYGLVVGLNGTGDSLASSPQTRESLVSMLERLGVNVRDGTMSGKNVAAVMVTATLPPFARSGTRIDVSVSAMGDAKDLQGGTLLVTSLLGADGQVYAVAQGNISVSGIAAIGANARQTKGVPTAGKISNGALVEKEVGYELADLKEVKMTLSTPDFTTAKRVVEAINTHAKQKGWGAETAKALDMGTLQMTLPKTVRPFDAFHEIGHLEIRPDQKAKIVIDDQNGVIAMGSRTRISPVALTHGSITIKVVEVPKVYMPELPNGGISPVANAVVGVNTTQLADTAKQTTSLKTLQAEQLRLLTEQQAKELSDFNTSMTTSGLSVDEQTKQRSQLTIRQDQQKYQLNLNFQQQLQNLQQQQAVSNSASNLQQINATNGRSSTGIPEPVVTSDTKLNVREDKGKFNLLNSGASIDKFVNALNQLGVSVRDMGAILMAIKNAGALHAEIIMS